MISVIHEGGLLLDHECEESLGECDEPYPECEDDRNECGGRSTSVSVDGECDSVAFHLSS